MPAHGLGTFTVARPARSSCITSSRLAGPEVYEYAGTVTNGGTGVQGTVPRVRFYSTLDGSLKIRRNARQHVHFFGDDIALAASLRKQQDTEGAPRRELHHWDLRAAYTDDTPSSTDPPDQGLGPSRWRQQHCQSDATARSAGYTDNNADVSTYSPIVAWYMSWVT